MKGRGKKHLHETPVEFAEAYDRKRFINRINGHSEDAILYETEQEVSYRRKEIRNMKMPAHPKPKGKRRLLYHAQGHPVYEDVAEYRKRIWNRAHRRAHKTTVPPKG